MSKKTFAVTQEFKEKIAEILKTKKYSSVYPYMIMLHRDELVYTEDELNSFISFLEEFSYAEVADFFSSIRKNVTEIV